MKKNHLIFPMVALIAYTLGAVILFSSPTTILLSPGKSRLTTTSISIAFLLFTAGMLLLTFLQKKGEL